MTTKNYNDLPPNVSWIDVDTLRQKLIRLKEQELKVVKKLDLAAKMYKKKS